ncbi:hypothetical protein DXA68_10190 [Bacteroides stercorirosoris]|uniref:Uncharacterized protein n=1 Tax=Bacteroides stercorirosoris TaxID=871324 RepID=A0A413H5X2_9BACE|nr:hypothetical protein DXA68_10190 [Bacteroides stercorirosoris]
MEAQGVENGSARSFNRKRMHFLLRAHGSKSALQGLLKGIRWNGFPKQAQSSPQKREHIRNQRL